MTTILEKATGLVAFVRTVEHGSFSKAARSMGATPSGVSKSVARLEERLGVRLLQRSTRALGLTAEGRAYYEHVAPLLRGIDEADGVLQGETSLSGLLRVTASLEMGRTLVTRWIQTFLDRHRALRVQLRLTETNVNLVAEGWDLALRIGKLPDTALVARKVVDLRTSLVATPQYLRLHGTPQRFEDLRHHEVVRYLMGGRPFPITLTDGASLTASGRFDADDLGAVREAVLAGAGLGHLFRFSVADDLASGSLVEPLASLPLSRMPVYAVHAFGKRLPLRVRLFIDFVVEQVARSEL